MEVPAMVKIIYKNGSPFIDIHGKLYEPCAFRSFRPKPDNISLITRCGVKLCQILVSGLPCTNGSPYSLFGEVWKGEGEYDFGPFDRQFEMFRRFAAPDAYFNVMLQLDDRPWWHEKHPDLPYDSYHHITEMAHCEEWKRAAADYLQAFITYAEEKYGDRIYAYSIAAGLSNEWFDHSLYQRNEFDRSDTVLTRLWRDQIGKPDAPAPTIESMEAGESSLRAPASDDYAYLKLATDSTSDLICFFAAEAQKVLHHEKLFGLFYGYINIQAHPIYWNTSGYEKVWSSPDIDMLYAPAAYRHNRDIDGVGSYQYAVDSIRASGKLYLHENDHRTEMAWFPLETGGFLKDGYKSFNDWQQVFRRELCNVMQKQSSFWWFDFFGGYYNAPEYERELTLETKLFRKMAEGKRESVSEIAVFTDPMSTVCTKEDSQLNFDVLLHIIDELLRCGAPFEFYNLGDIPKLDLNRYKLFVFLNITALSDELRTFIETKLNGRQKVFLHAAGMAKDGVLDIANTSALTGMHIAEFSPEDPTADYNGVKFRFSKEIAPMLRVEEADAEILARYPDGSAAAARKGDTVWCGVGNTPWQFWRDIAEAAGVHIYDRDGGGTAICSQFMGAYTTLTEDRTYYMKEDGIYTDLFSGEKFRCEGGVMKLHAESGRTLLLVKE